MRRACFWYMRSTSAGHVVCIFSLCSQRLGLRQNRCLTGPALFASCRACYCGGGGRGGRGGRFPKRNEASAPRKTGEVGACKDLDGNVFTIGSGNKGKDGDLLRTSKEKLALYIGTNYGDDACQEWMSEKQLVLLIDANCIP